MCPEPEDTDPTISPCCDSPNTMAIRPRKLADVVVVTRLCHECGHSYQAKYVPKRTWVSRP